MLLPERDVTARRELQIFLDLTRAIARTRTVEEIYAISLDALTSALHVSRAAILLFDPDGVMRFKAWRGLSDTYRAAVEGHSPWKPAAQDAVPIVVADVRDDSSLAEYRALFESERIAALVFIPLSGGRGVIGKFML